MLLETLSPAALTAQTETLRWILATTSQGSAAFVAIISGFQLSRILTISSMRQPMEARRGFIDKEIETLFEDQQYLEEKIDVKNRKAFAKLHLDEIVAVKGNREQIWHNWTNLELDQMPNFSHTAHFCKTVSDSFDALEKYFPGESEISTLDAADKLDQDFADLSADGVLEAVRTATNLERSRIRKTRESAARKQNPEPTWLNQINSIASNFQIGGAWDYAVHTPKFDFDLPDPAHNADIKRYGAQDHLLVAKMEELEHLDAEISRLKSSKGLKGAFALIATFGLVGVILPLILSLFSFKDPRVIAISMIAAFAGLFTFMVIYMFAQLKMVKGVQNR
jgi:hypothetical protein